MKSFQLALFGLLRNDSSFHTVQGPSTHVLSLLVSTQLNGVFREKMSESGPKVILILISLFNIDQNSVV